MSSHALRDGLSGKQRDLTADELERIKGWLDGKSETITIRKQCLKRPTERNTEKALRGINKAIE